MAGSGSRGSRYAPLGILTILLVIGLTPPAVPGLVHLVLAPLGLCGRVSQQSSEFWCALGPFSTYFASNMSWFGADGAQGFVGTLLAAAFGVAVWLTILVACAICAVVLVSQKRPK